MRLERVRRMLMAVTLLSGSCASAPPEVADRGIGGTGGPARVADRGIGGTGIIGVISGFGSIWLAGREVAFDPALPILVDGRPQSAASLRVGQVAIVEAAEDQGVLRARGIRVRYEVVGPLEIAPDGVMRVAGQPVVIGAEVPGERPSNGDWVAVGGLRRSDGVIVATRLERRPPGTVVVHGRLVRAQAGWRIGLLAVRPAPGIDLPANLDVIAEGVLEAGALRADRVTPDLLASDPAALFAPSVSLFVVEGFAFSDQGRIRFGQGFAVAASRAGAVPAGREVFALERTPQGLRASPADRAGAIPSASPMGALPRQGGRLEPAPMPGRGSAGSFSSGPSLGQRQQAPFGGRPLNSGLRPQSGGPGDGGESGGFTGQPFPRPDPTTGPSRGR